MKKSGFTLIELMIVVAIIAFLSMLSMPSLMRFLAKSKRTEAYVNLGSLAIAQRAYMAEHGKYTTDLNELGWRPQGNANYTYGFPGSEGQNYFMGKFNTDPSNLSASKITDSGFTIAAAGDIDSDGMADILTVDQDNNIKVVQDDLK